MKWHEETSENNVCLYLEGDATLITTPKLRRRLLALIQSEKKPILNWKKINYADTSAIAVFVEIQKICQEKKLPLVNQDLPQAVRDLFIINGVDFKLENA